MQHVKFPTGFGERLREERERIGLTVAELAKMTGVHRNTQARYEKESTLPTPIYLSVLRTLGIDINYLLVGDREFPTAGQLAVLRKQRTLDRAQLIGIVNALEDQLMALKSYLAQMK